jgi:hypothetical protein
LHKYTFKKVYINSNTREEVEVHTNKIEGAWKHAKDHFRKLAGTKITQFEGHLSEIMWRAEVKSDVYRQFFNLLKTVYHLNGPPSFTCPTPMFDTWTGLQDCSSSQLKDWEVKPGIWGGLVKSEGFNAFIANLKDLHIMYIFYRKH